MKKALFLVLFLAFAVFSYAVDLPNRSVFIEGTASVPAHRTFFLDNFRMEAGALGFNVANNRNEAGFIYSFNVQNFTDDYDPSIRFIILVTLVHRESGMEMVSFGWPFAELDDMYEHNQFVFYKAAVLIPSLSDDEINELIELAAQAATPDFRWRNKWIYLRASFDYPITFYQLLPEGLLGGAAVYDPSDKDKLFQKLDHIVYPMPGGTVGLEFQLLDFLSLEFNFQFTMGDTRDNMFFNMAAGAELKFPLKMFNNFIVQPYGTFVYPLSVSPIFLEFPEFFIGGGLQFAVKGGSSGAFFVDVNYLMALDSFGQTIMNNPWKDFPTPAGIQYNRFVIGIGVGYKLGFLDR
ncbi:MAG: hypothetical protein FWD24_09060 [Treponema sp.]|nr:hypothetical protein [Treponema sp.]